MKTLLNLVFTKRTLDRLLDYKPIDLITDTLHQYDITTNNSTYGESLNSIYSYISKYHRNEYFYKNQLLNKFLLGRHSLNTASALRELPVNNSIADFVLFTNIAQVFEIKTELDNLTRLSNQLESYYTAFEYVSVITDDSHIQQIQSMLNNPNIGLFVLTKTNSIRTIRQPSKESQFLNHEVLFQLLRKPEFEAILMDYFKFLPDTGDFEYYDACFEQFKKLPILKVQTSVCSILKERNFKKYKGLQKKFLSFPEELRSIFYFSNYKISKMADITDLLNQKINK